MARGPVASGAAAASGTIDGVCDTRPELLPTVASALRSWSSLKTPGVPDAWLCGTLPALTTTATRASTKTTNAGMMIPGLRNRALGMLTTKRSADRFGLQTDSK